MKNFSFLALIATILCLCSCGPKEYITPIEGTEYSFFCKSNTPQLYGVRGVGNLEIIPDVYTNMLYANGYFIGQYENEFWLLTPQNTVVYRSPSEIAFKAQNNWIECIEENKVTIFFPQEQGLISGAFESYKQDSNGNLLVKENGKYGIYSPKGNIIIPIKQDLIILDGENYIALNSKYAKQPILNDKGAIISWNRVKITAFDKDGKESKAPSLAQVKKLIK